MAAFYRILWFPPRRRAEEDRISTRCYAAAMESRTNNRSRYVEILHRAQDALERGEFEDAEALARRALMLRPESVEARQLVGSLLLDRGEFEQAAALFESVVAEVPDHLPCLADLGLCLFETCDFEAAEQYLARALRIEPEDAQSCYWMALAVERRGEFQLAERLFERAHLQDPEGYPLPTRISASEFEAVLTHAMDELPDEVAGELRNLRVSFEELPSEDILLDFSPPLDPCVFGLYIGVPLPDRRGDGPPRLPDEIIIYKRNLERLCSNAAMLKDEIKITLRHEIGHYLGFDEDELADRGLA